MSVAPTVDRRPLLLANGFMPFAVSLNRLADEYRRLGFEPYIMPFRYSDMMNARTYVQSIAEKVREIHAATGRRVDIVGISMGGVCSLCVAKHLGIADMIRTVVLVGSPVHGSPLSFVAAWSPFFSRTGRQLTYGSDFLCDVHDGPLPEGVRFVTLGGLLDFICPTSVTTLAGAENYIDVFGHQDVMFSPWLHRKIAELILCE